MASIKLILLEENLRNLVGGKEVTLKLSEGEVTVKELLREVAVKYGDQALKIILKPNVSILLNGKYIDLSRDSDAKLSEGDRVAIVPIVAGG